MKHELEYIKILEEELKPAMGCTEPIAIAYCASVAKKYINDIKEIKVVVSNNIIKNVKSVTVPNTGGLRGIEAACLIGITAGDADKQLECISKASVEEINKCKELLNKKIVTVEASKSDFVFDIDITLSNDLETSRCRIVDHHTNVVLIKKNDEVIFEKEEIGVKHQDLTDRTILNVEDIYDFACNVEISKVKDLIDYQIKCNLDIAKEGMKNPWGANIGKTLRSMSDTTLQKAKAYAAAGSDARMNGCNMPVVINSGSGNQGITCSVPVYVYANELSVEEEKMIRALILSNLLTIHVKTDIGRLSAYCGAVAAGCCAGCAIAYLHGGDLTVINHTLVNALAIASGIICDGAKASCAAKIALSVEAGVLGYRMYLSGNEFKSGDGIVKKGVENTIHSIGALASHGMIDTDKEIIKIMLED